MGTPVYQPAHGFRRGDPVVHSGSAWGLATGSWDGVVGLVYDRNRFEVVTNGFVDNLAGLTPGEVRTTADGTALWRAISPTRALLLRQSAGAVTNVTNVVGTSASAADAEDITVPMRRSWMGL